MRPGDLLRFIKVEHSVFALPFVYAGLLLAWDATGSGGAPPLRFVALATTAAIGARGAAMALNRILDRDVDARNPRTRGRELPAGRLTVSQAWAVTAGFLVLLLVSAALLNPLCLLLAPVLVPLFALYPMLKRHTALSHIVLGGIVGIAPVGGWLAVTGVIDPGAMVPVLLLWAAVGSWVAGFDIIYALDDLEFDRAAGLYSIPARHGIRTGLAVSYSLHIGTVLALGGVGITAGLSHAYLVLLPVLAAVLVYEHTRVDDIQVAFFYANGVVGGIALVAILAGIYLPLQLG